MERWNKSNKSLPRDQAGPHLKWSKLLEEKTPTDHLNPSTQSISGASRENAIHTRTRLSHQSETIRRQDRRPPYHAVLLLLARSASSLSKLLASSHASSSKASLKKRSHYFHVATEDGPSTHRSPRFAPASLDARLHLGRRAKAKKDRLATVFAGSVPVALWLKDPKPQGFCQVYDLRYMNVATRRIPHGSRH